METRVKIKKDSMKGPKTPKINVRDTPDGHSAKKRDVMKIKPNTPGMKKKQTKVKIEMSLTDQPSEKKKKRQKDAQSEESPKLKKRKHSGDANDENVVAAKSKDGDKKERKKAKVKKHDRTLEEAAVQKMRGMPDGAEVGKDDAAQKGGRKKSMEKKDKKPLKVLKHAVKNIKMFKKDTKGTKRKLEDGQEAGDAKKPKLVEMKKKDRKVARKAMKNNYDVSHKAKRIWEELRKFKIPDEKKKALCDELCELVKGKCKELIFAHDTCRVIQCLVKYGSTEHRTKLFEELKDDILEMIKCKYAKFFVKKLIKYGTKPQKALIFKSFYGKVRKLVRHSEASEILEYCYNEYANAAQRAAMVEEFYGPSFALFKTDEIRTLDQLIASDPNKKDSILGNMKEALLPLIDKNVLQHSIVHRIFHEFFTHASAKMKADMVEALRENMVHMVHTRDGARVGMMCFWHGTAKDRKVIIKSMKPHVLKMAKEEHGHLVLLAMFDSVDDTKLVGKAIIEELCKSVQDVALNQHGRKVLLYLLAPRDPLHFHPDVIRILQQGDESITSKKSKEVRRKELLDVSSAPLLKLIVDHTRELVMCNSTLLLVMSIITHAVGDLHDAMEAVAQIAAEPFVPGNLENFHIIEHPAGHIALKRLITNDKQRMQANETVLFSKVLLETIPNGTLKSWATCNRGCFILVVLMELENEEVSAAVKKEITPIKKAVGKLNVKGAQILLEKLGK
ncbi:pumilio homolog 3-like [Lineus longissimus]|uniref:pumilio homolog 3-like n=1 Tax=Lineus longissimus TaxID=88925 RepID=UPI002B4CD09C